jgi:ATP-dependent RNA helicase DeaD
VADVHARRLELTRVALRERLLEGNLDDVRIVVDSLANEFDILDVAAAAVKIAHTTSFARADTTEIPAVAPLQDERKGQSANGHRSGAVYVERPRRDGMRRANFKDRSSGSLTRIYIGAGRQTGIRPGDLVGAIAGETGIDARVLGAIDIADRFSLVEVPEELANTIIKALRATNIRGQKVTVRREQEKATKSPRGFFGKSSAAKEKTTRKKRFVSF